MLVRRDALTTWQYVKGVLHASDQHGPSSSISYTAVNIIGKPDNYPLCDEFISSYMLTTYGNWWREVPSYYPQFGLANVPASQKPPVHDFLVVSFEVPVFPISLEVYETFNPGAIRRVWAFNPAGRVKWELIYSRPANPFQPPAHRPGQFVEYLYGISTPVSVLRLEFDTSDSMYIPGYDGMLLWGTMLGPIRRRPDRRSAVHQEAEEVVRGRGTDATANILLLPDELLLNIFSHLDVPSLGSVGTVCKKFAQIARDPSLFREVNLRPYWMVVNARKLQWLEARCARMRKLDVSWCGMFETGFTASVSSLLQTCGAEITHLRLDDLPVCFSADQLRNISDHCPALEQLSLRQLQLESPPEHLSFENLTRLDVSRTLIGTECLVKLLPNNPQLQHLNFTCCLNVDLEMLVSTIATHNRELVSLNLWKAGKLPAARLGALQACTKLRELDIGWTVTQGRFNGILGDVFKCCPGMLKLGLAGLSVLQDSDVEDIARYCPMLEQLDMMGCISVGGHSVTLIFESCIYLRFADINHCAQIAESFVDEWTRKYGDRFQLITRNAVLAHQIRIYTDSASGLAD